MPTHLWKLAGALTIAGATLVTPAFADLPVETPTDCVAAIDHSFRLGGNVTCPPGTNGFYVTTSGVTIDLGGFTLSGSGFGFTGIQGAGAATNVKIRNGTVRGFGNGIIVPGTGWKVSNVTVRDASTGIFTTGDKATFTGNTIVRAAAHGFFMSGSGHKLTKNAVVASGVGIYVNPNTSKYTVKENHVTNCDHEGIYAGGTGHVFTKNVLTDNGHEEDKAGFELGGSGNAVSKNVIDGNAQDGFHDAGTSNKAVKNLARGNGFNDGAATGVGTGIDAAAATTPLGKGNVGAGNDAALGCVAAGNPPGYCQ